MVTAEETRKLPADPWPAPRSSLLLTLGWATLGWAVYAALETSVLYFYLPASGQGFVSLPGLARWTFAPIPLWIAFTPAIVALSRRFRMLGPGAFRAVPVHLGGALAAQVITAAFLWAVYPEIRGEPRPAIRVLLLQGSLLGLLRYFMVTAGVHAADYYRLYRDRHVEALRLRAELDTARLEVLKVQLQPHFLFNSLHAISELLYSDPRAADRALTRLADLLRGILATADRQEVSLAEELAFLESYLDIERIRRGGTLDVRLDAAEDTLRLLVPNLVLQPLAENALRHGLRHAPGGSLAVTARTGNGRLRIRIEDDGSGLPPGPLREGLGLRSTRVRLGALYGAEHEITIRGGDARGAVVEMSFPAREAGAAARPEQGAGRA